LYIVEVETGKETKLVRAIAGHADFRWSADSKSIRYVHRDTSSAATKGQAHFSIRQVQLTGASRQLRDIGVRNPPGWLFVDDQWILMANDGALEAADRDQTIKLYDPSRDRPGISPDGKWIARAPNGVGTSTVSAMYEIVSTNGQTRSTVKLSGALHSTTPVFSADSRFLIVPNANAGYDDKTPTEPAQIVAVPVNGDAPRTIATLPKGERVGRNMLTLSPDGRTLLYVGQREGTQSYFDIDFSSVIGSAKPGTKR
jgi:Tol biopolymer transport system component